MNIGPTDTLYSFDITENKNHVHNSSKLLPYPNKILDHPCERMDIFETHKSDVTFYIDQSFIFSRDVLKVNPAYFKNWRFSSFNTYIDEPGVLYLRCETKIRYNENIDFGTKIYEAVEINERVLNPKLFDVDTSIVKAFLL